LIEQEPSLVAQLLATQARLQATAVRVERGDAVAVLGRCAAASMDLIFLDPPFDGGFFEAALRAAQRALAEGGQIYLEAPVAWDDAKLAPFGLRLHRHLKAGAVHAHLLLRAAA
jgi:16S rRNA (guanine966-N2)-methyltransferase